MTRRSRRGRCIVLLAAVADNGVIGRDNALPFRQSTDLKRFKALTMGKPVLMGRKTYLSIGKPLAGPDQYRGEPRPGLCAGRRGSSRAVSRLPWPQRATMRESARRRDRRYRRHRYFRADYAPCRPHGDHPCACESGGRHLFSADRKQRNGVSSRAAIIPLGRAMRPLSAMSPTRGREFQSIGKGLARQHLVAARGPRCKPQTAPI